MNEFDGVLLDNREEVAEYHSVSRLAIVALLLGCASIMALFHPLSWLVPIVAVFVACLALRATSNPERPLDGRKAALTGMFLALFFGVAAFSYWTMERQMTAIQGRRFADRFLAILQSGDHARAVECTQTYQYRQPDTVPLAEFYAQDEKAMEFLQSFREKDVVQAIMEAGKDANIEFVRVQGFDRPTYGMRCWLQYQLVTKETPPRDFFVAVTRKVYPESSDHGQPHWFVQELEFVPEDGAR